MSTRAQIGFKGTDIKIYKHSDGYPEGVLPVLEKFLPKFFAQRRWDIIYIIPQTIRAFMVEEEGQRKSILSDDSTPQILKDVYNEPNLLTGWGITTELHTDINYYYHVYPYGVRVYSMSISSPSLPINKESYKLIKDIKMDV